jgi:hypothetical protein
LLIKPDSLCTLILKARYYPNGRLEDTVFAGNASTTWQAIQYGLELLKKGLVWRVGNGSQIRIWRDPWLPRPSSYRPVLVQGNCRLRRVSDLLLDNGDWNQELLRKHFSNMDIEKIMKIKASSRQHDDVLVWAPDRHGIFSVKSAYRLAWELNHRTLACATSRAPDGNRVVWDTVWGCPAPPKVRVFAWRLATNSLATWENKKIRKMEVSDICIVCGLEHEDTYHTFCRCPMAKNLWEAMQEVWPLVPLGSIRNTGPEWLLEVLPQLQEQGRPLLLMTLWRIWHVRNEVVHHKQNVDGSGVKEISVQLCGLLAGDQAEAYGGSGKRQGGGRTLFHKL